MSKATPRQIERFWSLVEKTDSCWLWKGFQNTYGYGTIYVRGGHIAVHRLAWMLDRGPIPKGLVIDHICRVRACVRVEHLRLLTRGQNVLIGVGASAINSRKETCPRGHKYDLIKKNGDRACRTCRTQNKRDWHLKRKVAQEGTYGNHNAI